MVSVDSVTFVRTSGSEFRPSFVSSRTSSIEISVLVSVVISAVSGTAVVSFARTVSIVFSVVEVEALISFGLVSGPCRNFRSVVLVRFRSVFISVLRTVCGSCSLRTMTVSRLFRGCSSVVSLLCVLTGVGLASSDVANSLLISVVSFFSNSLRC